MGCGSVMVSYADFGLSSCEGARGRAIRIYNRHVAIDRYRCLHIDIHRKYRCRRYANLAGIWPGRRLGRRLLLVVRRELARASHGLETLELLLLRKHLRRDWAHRCRICAGTGPTPATSVPRHLHLDWAHPCHICARTWPMPPTSAPGPGQPGPTSAPGLAWQVER